MKAMRQYIDIIRKILDQVEKTQGEAMDRAARALADASLAGHNLFIFGCNHAGLLAQEMYYRTGGMATINPIFAPGMGLDVRPVTMTSRMERMNDYGRVIVDAHPIKQGDVLMVHSVSGRNSVTVDAALRAKEKGVYVIALTNLATSTSVCSRHRSGMKLYQVADLVLDNCGCAGDAALILNEEAPHIAATSTAVGAAMLNAIMAQAVGYIVEAGQMAPVFRSANLDGGDAYNERVLHTYKDHIFYM